MKGFGPQLLLAYFLRVFGSEVGVLTQVVIKNAKSKDKTCRLYGRGGHYVEASLVSSSCRAKYGLSIHYESCHPSTEWY